MATVNKLLEIARAELGTKESPAGSNKVKYASWYGLDGHPDCLLYRTDERGQDGGNVGDGQLPRR